MSEKQKLVKKWLEKAKSEKISQAFLAKKLGMTEQNFYFHLNKTKDLSDDQLKKIWKILSSLIDLDEDKFIVRELLEPYGVDTALITYPILGQIPAGRSEITEYNDWQETDDLNYDPRNHFWLVIDLEYGHSMTPFLQPGDLVLCSINAKYKDGDIVAARWDKTKGAIKIYSENPEVKNTIALFSYNNAEKPIILTKDRIEQIYKVVNIKKK